MPLAPLLDTSVVHGDAAPRVLLALREADTAMGDADSILGGILVTSAWSSRGLRALNEEIALARVNLLRDRALLEEIRRKSHVG